MIALCIVILQNVVSDAHYFRCVSFIQQGQSHDMLKVRYTFTVVT